MVMAFSSTMIASVLCGQLIGVSGYAQKGNHPWSVPAPPALRQFLCSDDSERSFWAMERWDVSANKSFQTVGNFAFAIDIYIC